MLPPCVSSPPQVRDSQLCTTLELGERRLATVEHLLAALAGCGLTHVHLEVDGGEVPLLDGSAQGWVEAIAEAITPAATPAARRPVLEGPVALHRGNSGSRRRLRISSRWWGDRFPAAGDWPSAMDRCTHPERFVAEIAPPAPSVSVNRWSSACRGLDSRRGFGQCSGLRRGSLGQSTPAFCRRAGAP